MTVMTVVRVGLCTAIACSGSVQRYGPPEAAIEAISHRAFEMLLDRYVGKDGRVDYDRWQKRAGDVAALDRYLAQLTHASPENRGDLFSTGADRLSYWINLYNALVLREVLRRWPLDSVREVKGGALSYVVPGKGFFADLRFAVGGKSMSLSDIEHEVIRGRFADARIHFAINCASKSCPVLRRDAFDPLTLDGQLEEASQVFINDAGNVAVDHAQKRVRLSKIFDWYRGDFTAHAARRKGSDAGSLYDFLLLYARGSLADDLRRARAGGYTLRYRDYDWAVNSGTSAREASNKDGGPGVGAPFPDLSFALHGQPGGSETVNLRDWRGQVVLIDFWATYCKPCRASFPAIEALWQKHRHRGLTVVAVAQDQDPQLVTRFVRDTGVTFTIALDVEQTATDPPLSITSLPTEIVLDRQGVVRYRHGGLPDMAELEDTIDKILSQQ